MVTSLKPARIGRLATACIRGFLICFGAFAFVWGVATLVPAWQAFPLERLAARIGNGESFKRERLIQLRPQLDHLASALVPRPDSLRSAAMIDLRLAEAEVEATKPLANNPEFDRAETPSKPHWAARHQTRSSGSLCFGLRRRETASKLTR